MKPKHIPGVLMALVLLVCLGNARDFDKAK